MASAVQIDGSRRRHMDLRVGARSILVGAVLVASLALLGVSTATAHVVEVTTSLAMDQVQDRTQLKQALETEVGRVLATAIAFKPTVVALTGARQVGERLMVRLLIADEEGEQLIQALERDGHGAPGAGPDGGDIPPREIRL
jgi:putative copper export protein